MVVEFIFSLAVWAALFAGMVSVGRLIVAQHRALRVARYGTMLQSAGRLSEELLRRELEDYAAAISGDAASWRIETGRFLETPSSAFYRLMQTRVTVSVPGWSAPVTERVVCQKEASDS